MYLAADAADQANQTKNAPKAIQKQLRASIKKPMDGGILPLLESSQRGIQICIENEATTYA